MAILPKCNGKLHHPFYVITVRIGELRCYECDVRVVTANHPSSYDTLYVTVGGK